MGVDRVIGGNITDWSWDTWPNMQPCRLVSPFVLKSMVAANILLGCPA